MADPPAGCPEEGELGLGGLAASACCLRGVVAWVKGLLPSLASQSASCRSGSLDVPCLGLALRGSASVASVQAAVVSCDTKRQRWNMEKSRHTRDLHVPWVLHGTSP